MIKEWIGIIPLYYVYKTMSTENKRCVKKDLQRFASRSDFHTLYNLMAKNKAFCRLFCYRIRKECKYKYGIIRFWYKPLDSLGIEVVRNVGEGFMIYHGNSTIVYCYDVGHNFTVYQNVTVGRGKKINGIDIPIIGNNVTIYTGAIVIGGIKIGDNVKIGAGAVVTKDVPANCTVIGNPMKII